ncbi:pirin family protein [Flavisolibacter nicotianae]|uniref:pirin family protein n=1 Tax=Flavisolibacter nicotianae TaxID=2364882 RepID=UPI000EB31B58|nr:pirin family protein [Flavisolibacter nicotianae]
MKTILHKAATRGHAGHGWLESWHTFSFAGYHDPARVHFGALRVLNDDTVAPGMGFGKHPHDNMEIVSIPLEGDLEHSDSMGNTAIIRQGDVQAMSAGTGIVHSEKNKNSDQPVRFLQIWVFPNKRNVEPRYDQKTFGADEKNNRLLTVVSPIGSPDGGVQIHQDAWFSLGKMEKGLALEYACKKDGNGVYAFVLEGDVTINDIVLNRRDGLGITEENRISIRANTDSEILLMDVPL